MAKTKKSAPKSGNELLENPEVLAERLSRTEEFLEKNKNLVGGVVGLIAILILGYIGFNYYIDNKNNDAQRELFQAVYYYEADSLGLALNGDGNSYGFIEIMDEYSMTDAANLAAFYAGHTYIKLGDFESAIRNLKKFSSSDYLVQARAYSLIGDAYAEIDNLDEAVSFYDKAISTYPNEQFTPIYLLKSAITYEAKGDINKAIAQYKRIVDDYKKSPEFQDAQKHKARLEGL